MTPWAARMATPERIAERLTPAAAEEVRREYERLIVEEVSPGKWSRR